MKTERQTSGYMATSNIYEEYLTVSSRIIGIIPLVMNENKQKCHQKALHVSPHIVQDT